MVNRGMHISHQREGAQQVSWVCSDLAEELPLPRACTGEVSRRQMKRWKGEAAVTLHAYAAPINAGMSD